MTKSELLRQNKEEVIKAYLGGDSTKVLGRRYGCNHGLVNSVLREFGVELKKSKRYGKPAIERYDCLIGYMANTLNYGVRVVSQKLYIGENFVVRAFKRLDIDSSNRNYLIDPSIIPEMIKLYNQGFGAPILGEKFGYSTACIMENLIKNGVKIRPSRRYAHKKNILDNGINSPELAYMMGLWMTDGNIMKDRIRISMCDLDSIEKMKNLFEYTGPIYSKKDNRGNRKEIHELCINGTFLPKRFTELGCPSNKTHILEFPKFVVNNLLPDFIRGVMDGDGSLSENNCSITGNWPLLEGIIKAGIRECNLQEKDFHVYCRHPERNNNIKTIMLTKVCTTKPFLDWLYAESAEHMRMNRKYDLYVKHWKNREIPQP